MYVCSKCNMHELNSPFNKVLSGWEEWHYCLLTVNHSDSSQSQASISLCMQKRVDRHFPLIALYYEVDYGL